LWLLVPQEEIRAALWAQAHARGIDAKRLIFAPFVDPIDHLARLPQADLLLDTFPYGAHTTCSDALWMGLPVLTQVGRSFSARVAASRQPALCRRVRRSARKARGTLAAGRSAGSVGGGGDGRGSGQRPLEVRPRWLM
jgi:Glycosyl transferase family 41